MSPFIMKNKKSMGIFPGNTSNITIQLGVATSYLEAC